MVGTERIVWPLLAARRAEMVPKHLGAAGDRTGQVIGGVRRHQIADVAVSGIFRAGACRRDLRWSPGIFELPGKRRMVWNSGHGLKPAPCTQVESPQVR